MTTGPDQPQPKAPLTDARPFSRRTTLLFGLARYVYLDGRARIRFIWKRVGITLLVAGLLGWLAVATAAWYFVRYSRGFETVNFLDIALPHRWDDYQRKRGDDYIRRGREALALQHYREGFQMLRVGVTKSPANVEGRHELARLYVAVGRPDLGIKVLEEGAAFSGDDVRFLQIYIQLLLANQRDDDVRALVETKLANPGINEDTARLLALGGATAAFNRGNFDRAEDLLARPGLARALEARHLLARIEWERGFRDLAVQRLRALIDEVPAIEEPYATLFGWYRELKRFSEAESIAVQRVVGFPESMQARAGLLYSFKDRGSNERLAQEIERIFSETERLALMAPAIADFAIQSADVALADRLARSLNDAETPAEMGTLISIEARVAAKDYAGAIARLEQVHADRPEWMARQRATITGLGAVANYGIGKSALGELYLGNFLDQPSLRSETLNAMAARLRSIGATEGARRVFEAAVRNDPLNQPAITGLVEIDLDARRLDDVARNIPALLTMRKPPRSLLERARRELSVGVDGATTDRDRALSLLRVALEPDANTTR